MAFHPRAFPDGLHAPFLQGFQDVCRKRSRLARGEDHLDPSFEITGWKIAKHGDVPEAIKLEAISGKLAVGLIDGFLSLGVR